MRPSIRPSVALVLPALAFAALLSGCGGDRPAGCDEGVTACTTDAECGGDVCSSGCCTATPPCESDNDCREGTFCLSGFCGQPPDLTCDSDRDCANAGDLKKCDIGNRTCVACLNNTHCSANGSRICTPQKTCVDKPGGCVTNSDCSGRTDFKRVCDSVLRECVECAGASDCLGNNVCVDNTCVPPNGQCTRDTQCAAPTARCDTQTARCVACLESTDCGTGKRCDANTCVDASSCSNDSQCQNGERCKVSTGACVACLFASDCQDASFDCDAATNTCVARGCTSDAQCAARNASLPVCLEGSGTCVACENAGNCPANNSCTNNVCVPNTPTGCTSDANCLNNPTARKCNTTSGACVACLSGADCPSGRCDTTGACLPGCAADANCAAPTPKCNTSTNACVACVGNGDCTGGNICRNNACVPGCTSDAGCTAPTAKCDVAAATCVACLQNSDCTGGNTCQARQCVPPVSGGTDQPCGANDSCTSPDDVCWPEGTTKTCRKLCNPYAPTTCGTTNACEWIYFENAQPIGVCLAKNARGVPGAACNTADDCETGLLCTPYLSGTGTVAGRCTAVCNPANPGTACAATEECRKLPALYDADQAALITPRPLNNVLDIGLCIQAANNWGKRCNSDFTGNAAGATVADCGAGLTCGPNYGLIDDSIRVSTCQFPYGTGEADDACTSGSACKTGDCLAGPGRCNTTCKWTSDCNLRAPIEQNRNTYRCLRYQWTGESVWSGEENTSFTGACLQSCLSDRGCGTGTHCKVTTTFMNESGVQSSFHTYCAPQEGTPAGPQRSAGQPCVADGECASGFCVTNGLAGARDGYCFGACDPASSAASTQCNPLDGVVCDPAGVALTLNAGPDRISGNADDVEGRAFVCVGARCTSDWDCLLDGTDPNKPRSCQPVLQANVLNTQYPQGNPTPLTLRTACAPSLGTLPAGADCTADAQCASGLCLDFGADSICFGACDDDFDCDGLFTTCDTVDFGIASLQVCVP